MSQVAYFCSKSGVRIVAPGVSKAVDPVNGQDECVEVDGEIVVGKPAEPEAKSRKGSKSQNVPDASDAPASPKS